jgi:hypothetical protein
MARFIAAVLFAVALAAFGMTSVRAQGEDAGGGCEDYATRAEAQAALDNGTGDAAALDADGNGVVCDEGLFVFPDETLYECSEGAAEPCEEPTPMPEPTTEPDCGPTGAYDPEAGVCRYPDGGWDLPGCDDPTDLDEAQALLDSGSGAIAPHLDPDGDGIACNHDDEGATEPTSEPTPNDDDGGAVYEETTEVESDEPATDEGDTDADLPAEVDATDGATVDASTNDADADTTADTETGDDATEDAASDDDAAAEVEVAPTEDAASDDTGGATSGSRSATLPKTGVGAPGPNPLGGINALVAGLSLIVGGAGWALRRRFA